MQPVDNASTIKELTKAQVAFLVYCKEIGWGIIEEVLIKNGEPVYVKRAHEGRDLTR